MKRREDNWSCLEIRKQRTKSLLPAQLTHRYDMAEKMPNTFSYGEDQVTKTAKHHHRINLIRDKEEVLWAEIKDGVFKFLLFHTPDIVTWSIVLFEKREEYKIRFATYCNGTILINEKKKMKGTKKEGDPILKKFCKDFNNFKADVLSKRLEKDFSLLVIRIKEVVKVDENETS